MDYMERLRREPPNGRPHLDRETGRARPSGLYVPGDAYEGDPEPPPRKTFISSDVFAKADYRPQWLVPRVLVKGQPCVIAGPSKGLKTSISVDLAIGLASGTNVLGTFDVPRRTRVAVVSGESGENTLQETASRISKAKGFELESLGDCLQWRFDLPTFTDLEGMADFADELAELNCEVVIIDPVYLCLGNVDAKNLFEAGPAFRVVAQTLLKAGATPILNHHANRQLQVGEPMELQHLSYSGLEQLARQFFLINRREKYKSDGRHDLWLRIGGSAGHGGLWSLIAEEGLVDENFAGRFWNTSMMTLGEVQADKVDRKEEARREKDRKQRMADEAAVLDAIDAECTVQPAATKTKVRNKSRLNGPRLDAALEAVQDSGEVELVEFVLTVGNGATRKTTGFKRVNK